MINFDFSATELAELEQTSAGVREDLIATKRELDQMAENPMDRMLLAYGTFINSNPQVLARALAYVLVAGVPEEMPEP